MGTVFHLSLFVLSLNIFGSCREEIHQPIIFSAVPFALYPNRGLERTPFWGLVKMLVSSFSLLLPCSCVCTLLAVRTIRLFSLSILARICSLEWHCIFRTGTRFPSSCGSALGAHCSQLFSSVSPSSFVGRRPVLACQAMRLRYLELREQIRLPRSLPATSLS